MTVEYGMDLQPCTLWPGDLSFYNCYSTLLYKSNDQLPLMSVIPIQLHPYSALTKSPLRESNLLRTATFSGYFHCRDRKQICHTKRRSSRLENRTGQLTYVALQRTPQWIQFSSLLSSMKIKPSRYYETFWLKMLFKHFL